VAKQHHRTSRRESPKRQSQASKNFSAKSDEPKKEYSHQPPVKPTPIKTSQDFVTLEGNIIFQDFCATNLEIDIRELVSHHCVLHIYNTPYTEEDTLARLNNAASHIEHKKIQFCPNGSYYSVSCVLS